MPNSPARRQQRHSAAGERARERLDLVPSPWGAPYPSAVGYERQVAELAHNVRRPARCAVRDGTFPRGPRALGHDGMVPLVAAGEGSTLRFPGLLCWTPHVPCMTPAPSTSTMRRGAACGTPPPRLPRRPSLPEPPPPPRARRHLGGSRGGPDGLHTLSDSDEFVQAPGAPTIFGECALFC